MTLEMWLVLAVLATAIFFFVTEWVRVDVVALGVALALTLTNVLSSGEALAGFANPSVLTVLFLFVVGGAVMQTGLATLIGQQILKVAGTSETRLLVVLMLAVSVLSAFMSNTGTVAVLLPAVVSLGHKAKISPSKLLIPLSYGAMLGGAATLIGTPPNLLVNDVLREAGLPVFGFFSFLPLGILLVIVGTAVMALIGRNLLPDHRPNGAREAAETAQDLAERYHLAENMRRLTIPAESGLVGQTLETARFRRDYQVTVLKIMRPSDHVRLSDLGHNIETKRPRDTPIVPTAQTTLLAGDHLIVEGRLGNIERAADTFALAVEPPKPKDIKALVGHDIGVAEVIIRQRSRLIGKTLATSNFGDVYKLTVLEVRRPPNIAPLHRDTTLRFGDVLLVQGWWSNILKLKEMEQDLIVLGHPEEDMGPPHSRKATLALLIMLAMIVLMAVGKLPFIGEVDVVTVSLLGAVAMIVMGCVTMDEAYHAIDWKSIVLIAGVLPISTAMSKVGLVDVLANGLVDGLGGYGFYVVMIGLFLLTSVLTQFMSNTATAVLIAPLALATAQTLGAQPHAFLMTVAIAASCAFATPVASPTNTMVMGAGSYTFMDYTKSGMVMLLVSLVITVAVLPLLFPF